MLKRALIAVAVSTGVTFGLFFVMQSLVAYNDEVVLKEDKSFRFVDVVEDIKDLKVEIKSREIVKPPEVELPQPDLDIPEPQVDGPKGLSINIGRQSANANVGIGGVDLGPNQDGDYLPLVRVQPQYPRRAQERGIQGYVIVELTVSEDGSVPEDSIIIIEAEPKGYFERAAAQAARKFKYKPKVVNGVPQKVSGVQYRFTFELAEG